MEGFKHLIYTLKQIIDAQDSYREYLNTGTKNNWDDFIIEYGFIFNLCRIINEKMLPDQFIPIINHLLDLDEKILKYLDYSPQTRLNNAEKILSFLHENKKEIILLIKKIYEKDSNILDSLNTETSKNNYTFLKENLFKREDPKFYSLLRNL